MGLFCVSSKLRMPIVMISKCDEEEKSHSAAVRKAGHETHALCDGLGQRFSVLEIPGAVWVLCSDLRVA